jgi:ATP-dependent Clp protease ATP-binding subunit ClpC
VFERFTERSRRVVVLAQEEARLLDHNHIGTEHILLGLLHEGEGVAGRVLTDLGVSLSEARDRVLDVIGRGPAEQPQGHIPFTPRAKKVLELALREALELKQSYIGTEHILLGLVREEDSLGAQVLAGLGVPLASVRRKVVELAGTDPPAQGDPAGPFAVTSRSGAWSGVQFRVPAESLAEIRTLIMRIDLRLQAIERHLGLAGEESRDGGDDEDGGPDATAATGTDGGTG